jgi:maltose/moltooligosaccharide transporter
MVEKINKAKQHIYKAGTLTYTKSSLAILFILLMWGDFCYSMESLVEPSVLPFMFEKLKSSNTLMSIMVTTIPAFINFLLNPIISTASDRYRSRWGRRIPFMAFSIPFISLTLVATGYAPQIGDFLQKTFNIPARFPVSLIFLCTIIVLYRLFYMLVSTTFYYLFNDVVPPEVLGRFTTGFRVFGVLASSTFGWFGYKYIKTNPEYVCNAAALIYIIGFGIMCFKIKEGDYPPPSDSLRTSNPFKMIKVYLRECYCRPIYIYNFLACSFIGLYYSASSFGNLMLVDSMHVKLDSVGKVMAVTSWVSLLIIVPVGYLMDKYHPIRIWMISIAAVIILFPGLLFWTFTQKTGNFIPLYICIQLMNAIPFGISATALWPLRMRLYPREQYGQFGSATAMLGALFTMGAGIVIGAFLDLMKKMYNGDPFYYRYSMLISPIACIISLLLMLKVYRLWKDEGGDEGYVALTYDDIKAKNAEKPA